MSLKTSCVCACVVCCSSDHCRPSHSNIGTSLSLPVPATLIATGRRQQQEHKSKHTAHIGPSVMLLCYILDLFLSFRSLLSLSLFTRALIIGRIVLCVSSALLYLLLHIQCFLCYSRLLLCSSHQPSVGLTQVARCPTARARTTIHLALR